MRFAVFIVGLCLILMALTSPGRAQEGLSLTPAKPIPSAPSSPAARPASPATPSKKPQTATTTPTSPARGEVKIDPAFLQEMENFYGRCRNNSVTATYYDCRCLAVRYLDKRIELGRYYEPSELMNEIRGECANPAEIAGYSFGVCTKQMTLLDRTENAQAYCECFANAFAKSYMRNPQLSSRYIQILQRNAYNKCAEHRKD